MYVSAFKHRSGVPVFISTRVDRWSAAARLLIGAPTSLPVSHPHIDAPSTRTATPWCISSPFNVIPLFIPRALHLSRSHFPLHPALSFLSLLSALSCLHLVRLSRPLLMVSLLSSLRSSLFSFFRSLRSCLRLSIIFPRAPRRIRAARRSSFSPPCRPIIRSLFTLIFSFVSRPHTREPRNLHYSLARIVYVLLSSHSSLSNSDPFPWLLSKPRSPSRSRAHSLFLSRDLSFLRALARDFSRCELPSLPRLLLSSDASHPQRSRNGNFNT